MKKPLIHPAFRLEGKHFSNPDELLRLVEKNHPDHLTFLQNWLDEKQDIALQTSGSTGKPKTLVFPKQALIKSAERTCLFFQLPQGTRALLALSPSFVAGKMMWVRALHCGWSLDVIKPASHLEIRKTYDFSALVPMQVKSSPGILSRIKKLIIGGAPVDNVLQKKIEKSPNEVFLTYGMTETLTHVAVQALTEKASKRIGENDKNWFHTLPGIEVSLNENGCLVIHSPFLHYSPVVTNDLAEIKDNTTFKWLGRKDFVINSGGVKLIPEQIEKKLEPYISSRYIISSIPDEILGEKVVLVVEKETPAHPEDIYEKAGLSRFEKPKQVITLTRFPRTHSGKIKRKEIITKLRKYF